MKDSTKPCEGCGKAITVTLSTKLCSTCQAHANDAARPHALGARPIKRVKGSKKTATR